jgi:rod shape determining protein RodA
MMAEEVGFVGAVVVLALFFALLALGLSIALKAPSQFSRLVAAGMVINLTLYVVINVSMVTGLIPVVGIPLPLISYGGTAMLTSLVAAGLILGADAHRHLPLARFPVDL